LRHTHRALAVTLISAGLIFGAACGTRQPIQDRQANDLDRKLSTFAWIEDGDLVTFIVDTQATRYREESPYVPFEFAVANRSLKRLTLTRESFTLVDEEGNRYPAAGPEELLDNYEFLDVDRNLEDLEGIIFNKFAAYQRYQSNFSPIRDDDFQQVADPDLRLVPGGRNLVWDRISIPKRGYILDFIYFPQPKNGLKGRRFELFMSAPELEDPVFVKFIVK
jgi:hypothetical protein